MDEDWKLTRHVIVKCDCSQADTLHVMLASKFITPPTVFHYGYAGIVFYKEQTVQYLFVNFFEAILVKLYWFIHYPSAIFPFILKVLYIMHTLQVNFQPICDEITYLNKCGCLLITINNINLIACVTIENSYGFSFT